MQDSDKRLNLLAAYPYMKNDVVAVIAKNSSDIRFALDSGAFTAWKSGKPIKLDDYCGFIESLPFEPWRYFALDVIGDPHATMKNYELMLQRGFKPIPIFTRGEDLSVLDDYYKASDVVGLGGLVGTKNNKGFINGLMKEVGDRRVHWLGFTSMEFIKHYRPYMCDSSKWETGARYGQISMYMGKGKTTNIKKSDFSKPVPREIQEVIRTYGLSVSDFSTSERWTGGRSVSRIAGGMSEVRLSLDVQKNVGTLVFLACTTAMAINILIDSFHIEMKNKRLELS